MNNTNSLRNSRMIFPIKVSNQIVTNIDIIMDIVSEVADNYYYIPLWLSFFVVMIGNI